MKLSQLKYFVEVCECKNITEASRKLLISQPSITVSMRNLENELGILLFTRAHNKINLTKEGKYFYNKVKGILNDLDKLVEEVSTSEDLKRKIKIGAPPMISSFLMPKVFDFLKTHYPFISIDVVECGTIELEQHLLNESIDFAIMVENEQAHPSVVYHPILHTYDSLYINSNHPLFGVESLKLEDLKDVPIVLFNKSFQINKTITDTFKNRNLTPNILLQTAQVHTVKKFIEQGIAAGFLINECVSESDNFRILPLDVNFPITISIVTKKGREWYKNNFKVINDLNKYFKKK